jgi:hypothetical protein
LATRTIEDRAVCADLRDWVSGVVDAVFEFCGREAFGVPGDDVAFESGSQLGAEAGREAFFRVFKERLD